MTTKIFEASKFLFKISCVVTVLSMISVWFHKFLKDEDLCLVEYKSLKFINDIELPDVSLCIQEPLLEQNLNELGTNTREYLKHLSGDEFKERLISINYTNVTLNLENYYKRTTVLYSGTVDNDTEGQITSRLSAFYYGVFMKCYGIDIKTSTLHDINYVAYDFHIDPVLRDILSTKLVHAVVHSQSQLLLAHNIQIVPFDSNQTYGGNMVIQISKVEVVKRRNKAKNPCEIQWKAWNDLVLLKHTKDIGCVPSYHEKLRSFPLCSTQNETRRWHNIMSTIRNELHYLPCQQMPRIDFQLTNVVSSIKGVLTITVGYPEQMKIITQSRAVDVNALIGNIGGYIGLFLGNQVDFYFLIYQKIYITKYG